jgi:hypothetical protein
MDFLNRNASAVQAISAILTVLLALAALIGVKLQIDASDRIQRAQSARDIYREYLALAVNKPEFSNPDYCKFINTPQQAAYENYVEYMLYTAEQTVAVDADWAGTFAHAFTAHRQYICSLDDLENYSESVAKLISHFQETQCKTVALCGT